MEHETTEISTSCCGSLILETEALSHLTGDPRFESVALHALRKLWSMRSLLNLLETTPDVETDWRVGKVFIWNRGWYREADLRTGSATYRQISSLQAFWPGLLVILVVCAGSVTNSNVYLSVVQ